MISLKNIDKSFGKKNVLNNLSLDILENQVLAVLGVSGSGKTTMLNIICNLTDYNGQVAGVPDKISYIFQDDRLLDNLTVYENIKFVTDDEKTIVQTLKDVNLYDDKDKYPKQLSGGMLRRASIARAFCYPSKLLIMDEPFNNLDLGLKLKLIDLFKTLHKKDKRTVVFVTHSIDEALKLGDRVIILHNSKIIFDKQSDKNNLQKLNQEITDILIKL